MSLSSNGKAGLCEKVYRSFVSHCLVPLITRFLGSIVTGSSEVLRLEIPPIGKSFLLGGQKKIAANNNENEPVSLSIHNPVHFCWMLLLDQKIGLGEAYMNGDWSAHPGIKAFLSSLIRAKKEKASSRPSSHHSAPSLLSLLLSSLSSTLLSSLRYSVSIYNYIHHRIRDNTILNSRKNISEHYDLGNDMFELFLDQSMTYSCALFEDASKAVDEPVDFAYLEEAQYRKIDALLDTLSLTTKDHVLEIGCGWGSSAIRAVQRFGCRWTGLTISTEQLELARERVKEAGLEDKIDLKLLDYRPVATRGGGEGRGCRLEGGKYSAVLSVEMIEAVGEKFLPEYFQIIHDRLEEGGKAAIQAIVCPDAYYANYCRSSDFIKKHIFPGGHMPSRGAIQSCLPRLAGSDRPRLKMEIVREMGQHYSHTLDHWLSALDARQSDLLSLGYSPIFHRKWQFYFALCSALFAHDHIDVIQFTLQRATN